jgi:AraC-like DNA-binding protein
MALQLNIFLLLFGGLQGILLSLFLLRKKLYHTACIYLLLYLGAMLLQLTLKVMSKIWLMEHWPVLYTLSHYLPMLYGPLVYLFVKHVLQSQSFSIKESAHFIPFIFLYVITFISIDSRLPWGIEFVLFNPHIRLCMLGASVITYHLLAFRLWQRHRQKLQQYFSDSIAVQVKWVKQFIIVSTVVSIAVTAALYLLYINYPNGHQYRYGFVALTICIYWFTYTALTRPSVFSVIKGLASEQVENSLSIPQLKAYRPNAKYSNSGLSSEQLAIISSSLEKLMKEKKLFLQPDLTISQLAEEVNCSRHHLSQVLNDQLDQSYYDYINCLRVEEAKYLLTQPKFQQYKIASVAYDAGFNSLSTFNEVFKKQTGKTPSDYRKESLKEYRQQRV